MHVPIPGLVRSAHLPRDLMTFALGALLVIVSSAVAGAQTDYYNTDRGRPVEIEDAYPTERYAFELSVQVATAIKRAAV